MSSAVPLTSSQRDESGFGSPETRPAMRNGLVRNGELCQVLADHIGLDLHVDELLAIVDPDHAANHLRHNHHVAKVSFHRYRLLAVGGLLLGLPELLQQSNRLALDAPRELAALPGLEMLHELLVTQIEQLVQVHPTVGVLAEGPLLLVCL